MIQYAPRRFRDYAVCNGVRWRRVAGWAGHDLLRGWKHGDGRGIGTEEGAIGGEEQGGLAIAVAALLLLTVSSSGVVRLGTVGDVLCCMRGTSLLFDAWCL